MLRPTFRPTSSRVPLALAASFALTLAACGGDAEQAAVPVDEAVPVETEMVDTGAITDPATGDAVGDGALDAVADGEAPALGDGWQSLQADWTSSVASVQAHFGELSEEELIATGGDRDQLVALVQRTYDLEPAAAEQQVSDFEATL